jgi:beta-lactamase class A
MPTAADPGPELLTRLQEISATLPDGALGVSVFDYLSGCAWNHQGGRWFHAASTIKVAIMAAVFDAIDAGRFTPESRVHVRNHFLSAADGLPYRVQSSRDANTEVYAAIGRTMRVSELVRHMIGSSSNLATNLLLDVTGLEAATRALTSRGISGIDLRRGVEDDRAFQAGCNNLVTADGLTALLRVIRDGTAFSAAATEAMLDLLLDQRFAGAIAPGLPDAVRAVARVAHKTGDISTVSHDAGIVFLPGRPPYVVALLAESAGEGGERTAALAAASRAVYDAVAAAGEAACP